MSSSERRIDTRVNICLPLRFRALNNPGATEQTAHSENISQRGIFFETNVPLKVGTPVEVSLRMPQELAGKMSSDVKCVARVVHVRPSDAPGGMAGIGLHIERYEAKASLRERWAS
jgi:Tfp pilus assembly protein PilZ